MRQSNLVIDYNGKNITKELQDFNFDFSYTDASSGELDNLTIQLADRERKWQQSWAPADGDKIKAAIEVMDWYKEGDRKKLNCGIFHVDSLKLTGPPDQVSIDASSFPVSSDARQAKRTKVWEKVKLSAIAGDIAKRAGLKLVREVPDDPSYDRLEQQDQTDFAFLLDLTKQEGIACKVTAGILVLFDEAKYEKGKSVATFKRGEDRILDYSFEWSTANCAYRACELTYEESTKLTTDGKKKGKAKTVNVTKKVTYTPPKAPATGPVLRIKENAKSKADALRIAKNRLRAKNKQANLASMTVMGDVRIAAGVVVTISGFGRFDGKYIVDRVTHQIGSSGYITKMDLRKILGW